MIRMNKKGFAVSVVLYSIIFLVVTTLFMVLGLMRTRYNVNNELRENIIESINDEVNVGSLFPSGESCEIVGNTSSYTDNLILSIIVSNNNGKFYSWDNEVFSNSNNIKANRGGKYTGYFRDSVGGTGNCEIEIVSKIQYRSRACNIILYGEWYLESEENQATCTPITKEDAESSNSDTYRLCTGNDSDVIVKTYKRNPIGCDTVDGAWGEWSNWSDSFIESSAIIQTQSATTYKIK